MFYIATALTAKVFDFCSNCKNLTVFAKIASDFSTNLRRKQRKISNDFYNKNRKKLRFSLENHIVYATLF